jgi:hypothetical protein
MISIGETELRVESTQLGRLRVLHIWADAALYPRLGLQLAWTLRDLATDKGGPSRPPLVGLEIREFAGQLRLGESGPVVGELSRIGDRDVIRAYNDGYEQQVPAAVDLDPWRVEAIEAARNGGPPQLWLQVWPTVLASQTPVRASMNALRLQIPRDMWLEFLGKAGGRTYDVLEIAYSRADEEQFKRAVVQLREARVRIVQGEYNAAVELCRKAIEALINELPPVEADRMKTLFTRWTDEKRGPEYAGILSRVKNLSNFSHHELGTALSYSRPEAQFVVRVTEGLIALVGGLTAR